MWDQIMPYLQWGVAFATLALLQAFQEGLIKLAKRYLPRGSLIRRIVLLSRANEPD
jgi:hypothetical protein